MKFRTLKQKKAYDAIVDRRRTFAVRIGVFITVFVGVIGQHIVESMDPGELEIVFRVGVFSWSKLAFALGFSVYGYWKLDGKGDLVGKIKSRTAVTRALGLGLTTGYFIGDLIGKAAEVLA